MKLKPFYIILTAGFFLLSTMAWVSVHQQPEHSSPGCSSSQDGSAVVERVRQIDLMDLSPVNRFVKGI